MKGSEIATNEPEQAGRHKRALERALIVVATIVAYLPVLTSGSGFLWDDDAELWGIRGDLVQEADGPLRAWFPIELPEEGVLDLAHWRPVHGHGFWPLTPTVFWLEWRVLGADVLWAAAEDRPAKRAAVEEIAYRFHWANVLLHALNALLVVGLMRQLAIPGAFWIGLIFALHPIQVPSVAWISELKNTLSLCFALIATRCFVAGLDRERPAMVNGMAFVAFFLSLAAKTAAVGLPLIWTILALRHDRGFDRRRLLPLASCFAVAFLMAATTLWFTASSGGLTAEVVPPGNFWARLTLAGWVPWFYVAKMLWPSGLMMIYPTPAIDFGSVVSFVPGVVWAAMLGAAGWAWWRRGCAWPAISLLSTLLLLFPVAGFFDMTFMMHAPVSDHFSYMASVPIIALASRTVAHLSWRRGIDPRAATLVAGLVAVVLLGLTHQRVKIFRTQASLWAHNVRVNPDAWMAQYNLGSLIEIEARALPDGRERNDRLEASLAHLQVAAGLKPVYQNAALREASVLEDLGRDEEAVDAWQRALAAAELAGGTARERQGVYSRELARTLVRLGRPAEAITPYEQALVWLPGAWRVRLELAGAYEMLGRDRAAETHLHRALEARPRSSEAALALARIKLDSATASVRDAAEALRLARRARAAAHDDPALRAQADELILRARTVLDEDPVGH